MYTRTITVADIFICEMEAKRQQRHVELCIRQLEGARLEVKKATDNLLDIHTTLGKHYDQYSQQITSNQHALAGTLTLRDVNDGLGERFNA